MKSKQKNFQGQGATEYLVILGVVLLIGLVVISLLSFFPGVATDTSITESQIYWQNAKPLRITGAANAPNGSICTGSSAGGFVLTMENVVEDDITLSNVTVNGAYATMCQYGKAAASSLTLTPWYSFQLGLVVSNNSCTAGQTAYLDLGFYYSRAGVAGQYQRGSKKLMLKCSS